MRFKWKSWLLVVAWMTLGTLTTMGFSGCSGDGIPMAKVSGEVNYDGKVIEKGTITFQPTDGKGPSAGATIQQGQFSTRVPPGVKRVEIRSLKVVGKSPPSLEAPEGTDITEDVVPDAYNIKSQLTEEIKLPATTINLDLKPVAKGARR